MGQEDYKAVSSYIEDFRRRFRTLKGAEALCLTLAGVLILFSLGLGVQKLKPFFPYAPLLYSILCYAVVILFSGWTLFQWCRRISRESAALYIESRHPHLRNNLINSLQLYPQVAEARTTRNISTSMVLALLGATRKQLQTLDSKSLLNTGRLRTDLRLVALLFVPVFATVLFNPSSVGETFSLITHPLKDLPPSHVVFSVSPKDIRVARGSTVRIDAVAYGSPPKSAQLILRYGGEPAEKLSMDSSGERRFSATLPKVQRTVRYQIASSASASPWYTIEAVDPPEVGSLKITLFPPHYTGLPPQRFSGGSVEGTKGSSMHLEAAATKSVVKAKIILDGGREIPLKIDGQRLRGNLVLLQTERYQILVEDPLGFKNSPISYDLKVSADAFPAVELLNPSEDLQVNGDETLAVEFSARDDFGIQETALVARVGTREEKIAIEKDGSRRLIARERFSWDLGKLGLSEGEEITYHLEVRDNDTVSGPKTGSSRALRLRLKDFRSEHKQVADMIRELEREMIDLLGDHLERPPAERQPPEVEPPGAPPSVPLEQKMGEAMKRIEEVMRRTEKDRLSDFATWSDLEALKRNLQFTRDELLRQQQETKSGEEKDRLHDEIAAELERMSLLSEEIAKRLRAQELARNAQDLMKSQERLLESLEALKSGDKNLDAVLQEIAQLGKLLSQLQQALSQSGSALPEEFFNSEALRSLGLGEMFSALDEIRKKLMQGDIAGAMALARELFSQMAAMVAALQNAQMASMSSMLGRMQGEMMRSTSELEDILRQQQQVLVETEGLEKGTLQERDGVLRERLDRFAGQAHPILSELAQAFPDDEREGGGERPRPDHVDEATVNHLTKNMISRLLKKDFSGLGELLALMKRELAKQRRGEQEGKVKRAEQSLERLARELAALLDEPRPTLGEEELKRLRDLSYREGLLGERTDGLHEKLEALFQLFPSLDPKILRNLREATGFMGKAEQRLGDLDARAAVPPEREALNRLSESQQQMQSAMQQLAQRGQLGRMPMAYLLRRGRFLPGGRLIPLPGMPQFPEFEVEGGLTGLDTEAFRLPGKDDYKAPRSFREEILESLKQGIPSQHKQQIESYFRNLSE